MLGLPREGEPAASAPALARRLGAQSAIGKQLSAKQRDGLLETLAATLEKALDEQRAEVLKQFSLARKESALSRLLAEVTSSNGELAADSAALLREFSIDNEHSALFRLVSRVEQAQATITREFSLEHEDSALCRLASLLDRTAKVRR
jgi:hypothetical protein